MCSCRSRKIVIAEDSQINLLLLASVWEIWRQTQGHKEFYERACKAWWEAPAMGSADQETCLPIHLTPPFSWLQLQDRHTVPNTPPPLFTQPSEANRLQRSSSFRAFTPGTGGSLGQINSPEITPLSSSQALWSHFLYAKLYMLARKQYNLPQMCLRSVGLYVPLCMITVSFFWEPLLSLKWDSGRRTIQAWVLHKTIMRYYLTFGK